MLRLVKTETHKSHHNAQVCWLRMALPSHCKHSSFNITVLQPVTDLTGHAYTKLAFSMTFH